MTRRTSDETRQRISRSQRERYERERDELWRKVVEDYDRRTSTRWGRFLLWLLRKTT